MYDRLLKLLAEQGKPERQKTIFDVINTKKAVKRPVVSSEPPKTSEPPQPPKSRKRRVRGLLNTDRDEHQGRGSMG